jgi:arylformamidase
MKEPVYLSYFLNSETPVYGGAVGAFVVENTNQISKGDNSNNMHLSFPNHIGTHIDFPVHFSANGLTCSDYPPSFWIFRKISFLQCSIDQIELESANLPADIEILILKTGFGDKRTEREYWAEQPVIPSTLADFLKDRFPNLRVFGFDLISLTSKLNREEGKKAHLRFLIEKEILVLEDMNLSSLNFTPEFMIVAPLQVSTADGVPCNVIAF